MRVAVAQFATSLNTQDNLATCVRMIADAALCKPSLIVLPELCNTQFFTASFETELSENTLACYNGHNQAWQQALKVNGEFIQTIAAQAKKHQCFIVANVSLQTDKDRDHQDDSIKSNITLSSCLFSPQGELLQTTAKQQLSAQESVFFSSNLTVNYQPDDNDSESNNKHGDGNKNGNNSQAVVKTDDAVIGLLSGNELNTFEQARHLALSGAQILCHSGNAFSLEQSTFYGPARACENNVFIIQANKIGDLSQQALSVKGTGNSQIVSPTGEVLAKIAHNEAGVAFADIDLSTAGMVNKTRPDGTQLVKQRRESLYQSSNLLTVSPASRDDSVQNNIIPNTINSAIFATYKINEEAIEDVCFYIENNLSDIIQLPELFFVADKSLTQDTDERAVIERLSTDLINKVSAELRPFQYVCTSLILNNIHQAVIISEHGLFATQQQLHFCERYQWTDLAEQLTLVDLPLEQGTIKLAMLTADDATIPEIINLAASHHIHTLLVPFDIQAPSEVNFRLLAYAAENRVGIVAATREKSFAAQAEAQSGNSNKAGNTKGNQEKKKTNNGNKKKVKTQKSTGFIADLSTKDEILKSIRSSKFDGYVNQPLVKHQHGKITKSLLHPLAATEKF